MHADPHARTLRVGVTELCQQALANLRPPGGVRALWLGQSLHLCYQREAAREDPDFAAEVSVRTTLSHEGWTVTLQGRVDGLRPADGHGALEVEELKSGAPPEAGPLAEAWELQAALYAWMLARERSVPVSAELVFLGPDGRATERQAVAWDAPELEGRLHERLDTCIRAALAEQARRAQGREAAAAVPFPHPSLRPGQQEVQEAVEHALDHGEHLLLEAPTGTGKTAAALTPTLRHVLHAGRRLFVLTASTLQQHLVMDTLRALAPEPLPLAVRLRTRARMCPPGHQRCHPQACERLAEHGPRSEAAGLPATAFSLGPVLEPEAMWEMAEAIGACPFEASLEAARHAFVTVADYNYAFDPAVALTELRDPRSLRDAVLLVDEVHNLPERAREALGVAVEAPALRAAAERCALGSTPLHRDQREVLETAEARIRELAGDAGLGAVPEGVVEIEPDADAIAGLADRFDGVVAETLIGLGDAPGEDPFLAQAFAFRRLARELEERDPGFVPLVEMRPDGPRLELFCRDPSRRVGRVLGGAHAFVGLSGTIPAPEALAAMLGLDTSRQAHSRIPSPFGPEQRRLVIDASVDTTLRARTRQAPRIARRLAALAEAVPGNTLAVLPSHAFLHAVHAALPPVARQVLAQPREMPESERAGLLEELAHHDDRLVLAVAGGALAEGVDYSGGRLKAVAVVGPCLPALDLRRQLVEAWHEEHSGAGFEHACAVPGMIRVVQSAGRLIRSERDRGVVALFGRRFLREPFCSLVPEAWREGRPLDDFVGDAAQAAQDYFRTS